jgi:hypothetical protein
MSSVLRIASDLWRRLTPGRALALGVAAALLVSVSVRVDRSATQGPSIKSQAEWGKRMYREGLWPSGQPIRATVQGDITLAGTQFKCASCHRWSGFGSSESAVFVPPVTGPSLYRASELRRADLFRKLFQEAQPPRMQARLRDPRLRPAYTDQTLAIALREGRDPAGHALDPLMPRYQLNDEDIGCLIEYLKSLSSTPAPGVTKAAIHFATVITEGVAADKRQALLEVIDAYLRWKNADTQRELQRPKHSPWYKDDFYGAYREWVLHVWELQGPQETWPQQLETHYREQPVFALLSGMASGEWRPVHDFCERAEVPCLFPQTDLPAVSPAGAYSLYLSQGLILEAEALARYLHDQLGSSQATRIVQVYRQVASGLVPARTLRRALQHYGVTRLQDRVIEGAQGLTPSLWKHLLTDEQPAVLVLWLGEADLPALESAQDSINAIQQLYLSASLLKETPPSGLQGLRDKIYLTYPFALPQFDIPQSYRVRAWLRSRGVKSGLERIQLNTYFALSVADHALAHLVENFSRDYFIENIEQETENALNPGIFPHLSLGPGQRFASKGSYIVKLSDQAKGGLEAVSDWIIP